MKIEEEATNYHTMRHIEKVRNYLGAVVKVLLDRAELHDQSKLESPEVELFTEYTPILSGLTYGSQEYNECKSKMDVALQHHYANNRHHPEFNEVNEEWKDVIGYENSYQISNRGRLRSKERDVICSNRIITKKELIRKAHVTPKGYARVMLQDGDKKENKFIHTLVATSFLGIPDDRMQVNHKNGNKLDNRLENLEWATPSENLQHAYDTGLKDAVVKYVVTCNELGITTYGSEKMEKALRDLGYEKANSSSIHRCITRDGYNTHLNLTFSSENIDEYRELNSPVNDMTLIDLIEMLVDWKAASERHNDGNILKSIEHNGTRFEMSPQLIRIFENTAKDLF